jgi:hypothetical protein
VTGLAQDVDALYRSRLRHGDGLSFLYPHVRRISWSSLVARVRELSQRLVHHCCSSQLAAAACGGKKCLVGTLYLHYCVLDTLLSLIETIATAELVEPTIITIVPSVLLLDRDVAPLRCCLLRNDGLGFDDGIVTLEQSSRDVCVSLHL